MIGIVVRRLLSAIPLMLLISLIVYVLGSLAPGSVAESMLGANATPDKVEELNRQLGADRPLLVQYGSWLGRTLTGDLGTSIVSGRPVTEILMARMPVTLSMSVGALLLVILLGASVGTAAAVRGGFVGRMVEFSAVLVRGLPSFWIAMIAALVFGVNLMWLPVSGYVPLAESPIGWARSLALPVIVLGLTEAALVAIVTRAEMLSAMRSDFVRSLRANGYPWKRIVFKHIAKNAAGPVVTMVSLVFVSLLGGTILMEQIFGLPGLGTQMVTSNAAHDLPVIQGLAVFYTMIVVAIFLISDIAQGILNPKVVAR